MMKKFSIALLALAFSMGAVAQGKVVIFNMQAAIENTSAAKQRLQALEADSTYAAMRAKYEGLRAEMMALEKDAQTNNMTWTTAQKQDYVKQVEYKKADLKLVVEKLKAEQGAVVQRIRQEMVPKAKTALNQLVVAEGLGLVLDSSVAYYAGAEFDITAKVTEMLNKAK